MKTNATRAKRKAVPFREKDLDVQVREMRSHARDILLFHGATIEGYTLLPDRILGLAGFPTTLLSDDRALYDQLSQVHHVSFALGIAIGQMAPWIGGAR
jgi:hypothetical protein